MPEKARGKANITQSDCFLTFQDITRQAGVHRDDQAGISAPVHSILKQPGSISA